jgi:hypothetical protein
LGLSLPVQSHFSLAKPGGTEFLHRNTLEVDGNTIPCKVYFCINLIFLVIFQRIPNQFFLGSQSEGAAPFVQYQGEYHDGVEKIVELVKMIKPKSKIIQENDAVTELRQFSEDVAFKLVFLYFEIICRNIKALSTKLKSNFILQHEFQTECVKFFILCILEF